MENGNRVVPSFIKRLVIIFSLLFCLNQTALADPFVPLLLEVNVDGTAANGFYRCYEDQQHRIWVSRKDLRAWGITKITGKPVMYLGKAYYSLANYPGIETNLNESTLTMDVTAPARYFAGTHINLAGFNPYPIRPASSSLFLNYDLAAIRHTGVNEQAESGLFELGWSNPYGVFTNSALITNQNTLANPNVTGPSFLLPNERFLRLDTTWTLDQPEDMATWRFGDSITGSSDWSGSARFGGVQYATNFSTQPTFITFPLPAVRGAATLPTNVQLFVNGVLNQTQNVTAGAYDINNIPVVTGAGTVSVVTQDLLGRTQVISLPYYTSPVLLKTGLSDYSYEAGMLRQNYGLESDDYHDALAVATYDYGLTDNLTLGTHDEWLGDEQTIGGSAYYLLGRIGVFSGALAASHSDLGGGWLGSVGFTHEASRLNFGFKSTYMSSRYQQIGNQVDDDDDIGSTTNDQVFVGYDTGCIGSFGLSYTYTRLVPLFLNNSDGIDDNPENEALPRLAKIATLSYNTSLPHNTSLLVSFIKDFHDSDNNQFYLSLVVPLDAEHSVNGYVSRQNHETQPGVMLTKNLPLGNGYGYHLVATNTGMNGSGGDFTYQNNIGTYTAKAYKFEDDTDYEADVSGAVVLFDDHFFLARKITDSFALVDIPDYDNVRVYYQNQLAGRTNRYGELLVPDLLPYQTNTLAIETRDLPLTTTIGHPNISITPYYRSGVLAEFDVAKSADVVLHLDTGGHQTIPVGAEAIIAGKHYIVGYDGLLFFADPGTAVIAGKVRWQSGSCTFAVPRQAVHFDLRAQHVICAINGA